MRWITNTDLKNWAPKRDCQEHLPLLVRKLIRATTNGIDSILFPAGDNVVYGGWDGILISSIETEYIPLGISLWEFGTEKEIQKKANKDYEKRKVDSLGYKSNESTFVFVTPYNWPNKESWSKIKKTEGYFKDVIVYDGEYLEEWIDQAPVVGAWLSKYLEIFPDGVEALEDFWVQWISNPKHKISPSLVTAGRDNQIQAIDNWVQDEPNLLQIKSTSKEESLAFLCAAIESLPDKKEYVFSKALIVLNEKDFKTIARAKRNLFLIPYFEQTVAVNQAIENNNHVYNPLSLESTTNSSAITLPRLARSGFISALEEMGFSENDSQKLSKNSARVLSVFRRILQYDYNQPKWAKRETSRYLIPALLIGKWHEQYVGDIEVVNKLTGIEYDNFISNAKAWTIESDPPLLTIGDKWRLTSPIDAWSSLSAFLTKTDITKFENLAIDVIAEKETIVRNEHNILGMGKYVRSQSRYSNWLREGLCQSLIMIAVFGESYQLNSIEDKQDWVDRIVSRIMYKIDAETIFYINPLMMSLAEASPKVFLSALQKSLIDKSNDINSIFTSDNNLFTDHQHTRLLFALEMLAWDPLLLNQVISILIDLIKIDPGVTIANKPSRSLYHIFLPWCPQTYADSGQRYFLLESIINKEPTIGWQLLTSLLPSGSNTGWFTTKYQWRQIADYESKSISHSELYESYDRILTLLLLRINGNTDRLSDLFDKITHLYYPERAKLIQFALDHSSNINGSMNRLNLILRDTIVRSRAFSDTDWALSNEHVKKIETIYNNLSDLDDPSKYLWLFESAWPTSMEYLHRNRSYNDEEYLAYLKRERSKAIKTIYEKSGTSGIWQFLENVKIPQYVGEAFATILEAQEVENYILSFLSSSKTSLLNFSKGFVNEKSRNLKQEWANKSLEYLKLQNESETKIVNFILSLSYKEKDIINFASSLSESVQNKFWLTHEPYLFETSDEDKIFIIEKLIEHGRYGTSLSIINRIKEIVPSKILVTTLSKLGFEGLSESESKKISTYDIEEAIELIHAREDIDDATKGGIEWLYIKILDHDDPEKNLAVLLNEINKSPSFFKDLITFIYKPKGDYQDPESDISDEIKRNRALSAYSLLSVWRKVPGTDSHCKIDGKILTEWIEEARKLCLLAGRLGSCDHELGALFGRSPSYNDHWPQEPVCRVIEEIGNSSILSGFHTSIINKRGLYSKSMYEGGAQEKTLADKYKSYAKSVINQYPKVANELLSVAKNYEQQARGEDFEAIENDLED